MAGTKRINELECTKCGTELNEFNSRGSDSVLCLDCQQARFDALAEKTSSSLATFYCCIAFDVPFDIKAVPDFKSVKDAWKAYCNNLRIKKLDLNDEDHFTVFLDGVTDITEVFGSRLTAGEFNKAIGSELSMRKRLPGTQKQREIWGLGDPEDSAKQYTTADYDELDRQFKVSSSRLDSPDIQQENILRNCARWGLKRDKLVAKGDINNAQKLDKMIQDNLSSENLRKKDAKPIEDLRIDSIIDRLEKAGLMKKGKLADPDVIFEAFFGRLPKFSYTADAADQMTRIIWNRMQNNDGLPELMELPDDMRISDALGEFAEEPDDHEKLDYERLGLVKMAKREDESGG